MKRKSIKMLAVGAIALGGSSLYAGDVFLTGHDILLHGGGDGYSEVILDYLRGEGTGTVQAKADYDIAIIGSGAGFASFSDTGGPTVTGGTAPGGSKVLPLTGGLAGYGSATYYRTGGGGLDFAAITASADVLVILSHTTCGGCDLSTAGSAEINAAAPIIETAFNAGMDIWGNSGATLSTYYDFLPPSAAASGPSISGSNFSPTADGTAIGITEVMTDGDATHNRFDLSGSSVPWTIFETRNPGDLSEIVSIGLRDGTIVTTGGGTTIVVSTGTTSGPGVPDSGSSTLLLILGASALAALRRFTKGK